MDESSEAEGVSGSGVAASTSVAGITGGATSSAIAREGKIIKAIPNSPVAKIFLVIILYPPFLILDLVISG
ncbi:MAG: hypothetical protein WAO57_13260 [Syntrophomonadaceae bacterium]